MNGILGIVGEIKGEIASVDAAGISNQYRETVKRIKLRRLCGQ